MKIVKTGLVILILCILFGAGIHPTLGDETPEPLGTVQCVITSPDGQVTLFERSLPFLGITLLLSLFEQLKNKPQRIPGYIGLLEKAGIIPGDMERDFNIRLFTYGKGDIYIPETDDGDRLTGFWGIMIKPIIYNYASSGVTWAWHGGLFTPTKDFWGKLGRQRGVVIGFKGLCIKLSHSFITDTHLMIGKSLLIFHQDIPF